MAVTYNTLFMLIWRSVPSSFTRLNKTPKELNSSPWDRHSNQLFHVFASDIGLLTLNLNLMILGCKPPQSVLEDMDWWSQEILHQQKAEMHSYDCWSGQSPLLNCFYSCCLVYQLLNWKSKVSLGISLLVDFWIILLVLTYMWRWPRWCAAAGRQLAPTSVTREPRLAVWGSLLERRTGGRTWWKCQNSTAASQPGTSWKQWSESQK